MPYAEHDELYWNATGNEWGVPILSASATVIIPQLVEYTEGSML